jgi:hypothetical protein
MQSISPNSYKSINQRCHLVAKTYAKDKTVIKDRFSPVYEV